MQGFRFGAVALCAAALALAPAVARHARPAPPAHNFVTLAVATPEPHKLDPQGWSKVYLLDAASVRHSGDIVSFDTLVIGQNFQGRRDPTTHLPRYDQWYPTRLYHYTASCAWRSIEEHGFDATGDQANMQWFDDKAWIIGAGSDDETALNWMCDPHRKAAPRGAPDIAAAVAPWKDMFVKPGEERMMVTAVQSRRPAAPDWISGTAQRFVAIASDPTSGNRLYLDGASLSRDGDAVVAITVELLGPAARGVVRWPAAVRRSVYDCATRSLRVEREVVLNRSGGFVYETTDPAAAWPEDRSAVIKAEIDAACGGALPAGPGYESIAALWAAP